MCCGRPRKRKPRKIGQGFRLIKARKLDEVSALSLTPSLKQVVMCRPKHYDLQYVINPWMSMSSKPKLNLAVEQWDDLRMRIEEFGGEVTLIKPRPNLPDMPFAANGGLMLKDADVFVVSNFMFEQRQPEQWWFRQHFVEQKVPVHVPAHKFEGNGDALFLNGRLVGGYGFRSESEVYDEIRHFLNEDVVKARLIDPKFYHLDTCFCPLDDGDYMIYPEAFDAESLDQIRRLGQREIAVSRQEAEQFVCNAVTIGKKVILPTGCDGACDTLASLGYEPHSVKMSEFIKTGGAAKCLTLEL